MKNILAAAILAGCGATLSLAGVRVTGHAAAKGTIGLGTWKTQAEYKEIEVTAGEKVLYRSDFATEAKGWTPTGGEWAVVSGAYRQNAKGENLRSILKLPELSEATDYTVHLKARKISGNEGFLVFFHVTGDDFYMLNLGGWSNTGYAIKHNGTWIGKSVRGKIDAGRWYDIRIELTGPRIQCFMDGAPVLDIKD